MNLTHDGLTLWYGTPDAPGPFDDEVVPRVGVSLVVGVHPANPMNTVLVRYRVDNGPVQAVPGRDVRTDYARGVQYFLVSFPRFVAGDLVEYWPVFGCGGRQVPAADMKRRFRGYFRLEPRVNVASSVRGAHSGRA